MFEQQCLNFLFSATCRLTLCDVYMDWH